MDIVGPLTPSTKGHQYILVVIDLHSHFCEFVPLATITSKVIAAELIKVFSRTGIPSVLRSDQAQNFISKLMQELCSVLGITHMRGSCYHPFSQAACERTNGTLKMLLRVGLRGLDPRKWPQLLPLIAFTMHSTVHESTGYTPFQLIYGYNVKTPISMFSEQLKSFDDKELPLTKYVQGLRRVMRCLAKKAVANEEQCKIARKEKYDRTAKVETYKVGDQVYVMRPFKRHTLESNWIGPLVVEKVISPINFLIGFPGTVKPSRVVHANMLRHFIPRVMMTIARAEDDEEQTSPSFPSPSRESEEYSDIKFPKNLDSVQMIDLSALLKKYRALLADLPELIRVVELVSDTIDKEPMVCSEYQLFQVLPYHAQADMFMMLSQNLIAFAGSRENQTSGRLSTNKPLNETPSSDARVQLCLVPLVEGLGGGVLFEQCVLPWFSPGWPVDVTISRDQSISELGQLANSLSVTHVSVSWR